MMMIQLLLMNDILKLFFAHLYFTAIACNGRGFCTRVLNLDWCRSIISKINYVLPICKPRCMHEGYSSRMCVCVCVSVCLCVSYCASGYIPGLYVQSEAICSFL